MRVALIGYGKMGKEIEKILLTRGHSISVIVDKEAGVGIEAIQAENTDVAIEFTQPDAAVANITYCFSKGVPIVCGTTGWLKHWNEIYNSAESGQGTLFYASNYSVGVNLFFHFNRYIAKVMNQFGEYNVEMEEIHHIYKKDAPSGTAITAAEGILAHLDRKKEWVLNHAQDASQLRIVDKRIAAVPGTHTVTYHSPIDSIELKHTAFSREGFAKGAVLAAEFIQGKKGVFGMDDLLKIG